MHDLRGHSVKHCEKGKFSASLKIFLHIPPKSHLGKLKDTLLSLVKGFMSERITGIWGQNTMDAESLEGLQKEKKKEKVTKFKSRN